MPEQLNAVELIRKKRDGHAFTRPEIEWFVRGASDGTIPDYQLSALMMAIFLRGMTDEETRDLTLSMAYSGEVCDLSPVGGICADKHSTGGVGDTTTLVLVPLVAACGGKVAKMSGRGLGHTGGTLDKLESIPGFQTEMPTDAFIRQIQQIGCAVIGQSRNLTPADRALYRLRDVTATVESVPLIVSSIMSKKIAAGSGAIVLDVKTGNGALMRTLDESIALAEAMVRVGSLAGRPTTALVTGMDQPLGTHIGNALEVKEAIDILSGRAGGRLLEISIRLGAMMLVCAGIAADERAARELLEDALARGAGLRKLKEMILAQGGNADVCDHTSLLPAAAHVIPVPSRASGYVSTMDTTCLGDVSQRLGAGRRAKDDLIDPAVGIVMDVELGSRITAGQPLAYLHLNAPELAAESIGRVQRAIAVAEDKQPQPPHVYAIVRDGGVIR
ncbi:MAG: thymidine phosphorylase [Clostridia bacterium]|nr:thymidine phosphorylase [Clostridia bacterium]